MRGVMLNRHRIIEGLQRDSRVSKVHRRKLTHDPLELLGLCFIGIAIQDLATKNQAHTYSEIDARLNGLNLATEGANGIG